MYTILFFGKIVAVGVACEHMLREHVSGPVDKLVDVVTTARPSADANDVCGC